MNRKPRQPESARLWSELINQNPTNDELCSIVVAGCGSLQVRAAGILLLRQPTNAQLCSIIEHVSERRVAAAHMLLKQNATDDELDLIMKYVDSLYEQANRKRSRRPRAAVLSDILALVGGHTPQQG